MSLLQNITHSTTPIGIRAVIYGQEKMGKTTLAASAPRPLLIPLETGYGGVKIHKTNMPKSFGEVMALLEEVGMAASQGNFEFKTLIFDSGTALERLIHEYTISTDRSRKPDTTMESALGGFGKAYSFANDLFDQFLKLCDRLAFECGINIFIPCHAFAAKTIDPTVGEFDTWELQLHSPKNQKTYGKREMITQWADLIGFLHEPFAITVDGNSGVAKGLSTGEGRQLAVSRSPNYVAGNRYGLSKPINIPEKNGWNSVAQAIQDSKGLDFFNKDQ